MFTYKVLVADDDLVTLKMLESAIRKEGYEVLCAQDGEQALALLNKTPNLQLAVLDWMMPGMDGIEVCRRFHQENKGRLVHMILLTMREGMENIRAAFQAGVNDYVTKPFKKEELLARLSAGRRILDLQRQLTQSQKLDSVGQLASGIAHEINTPIHYIGDNIHFLEESFGELADLLNQYSQVLKEDKPKEPVSKKFQQLKETLLGTDVDYLLEEIPQALKQSLEGVKAISEIVGAMKEFAHPGIKEKRAVDINHAIASTIAISRNQWKYVADLETNFDTNLPPVQCLPGEFSQVILNLLINATDAIKDVVGENPGEKGKIVIATRRAEDAIEISISDTGGGIQTEIQDQIFDPFFTTKEVGKGSGQGLAIAHSIIHDKHNGQISFTSQEGKGTTFLIRLPIKE